MRLLRFARNDTIICHCEERSDEAISERYQDTIVIVQELTANSSTTN